MKKAIASVVTVLVVLSQTGCCGVNPCGAAGFVWNGLADAFGVVKAAFACNICG